MVTDKFDFIKEFNNLYSAKSQTEFLNVPKANFVAVRGKGSPYEERGSFRRAVKLITNTYEALQCMYCKNEPECGRYAFKLPPLEALWWKRRTSALDYAEKSDFYFIAMLRLPDFITRSDIIAASYLAEVLHGTDCRKCEFISLEEGMCAQRLHRRAAESITEAVLKLQAAAEKFGFVTNLSPARLHHEVYLSNFETTPPERFKVIIRQPISRKITFDRN